MGGQIWSFFISSLVFFVSLKGVYTCECEEVCKVLSQIQKQLGSLEGKLDALAKPGKLSQCLSALFQSERLHEREKIGTARIKRGTVPRLTVIRKSRNR